MICPNCKGSREIPERAWDGLNGEVVFTIQCPTCMGTGFLISQARLDQIIKNSQKWWTVRNGHDIKLYEMSVDHIQKAINQRRRQRDREITSLMLELVRRGVIDMPQSLREPDTPELNWAPHTKRQADKPQRRVRIRR